MCSYKKYVSTCVIDICAFVFTHVIYMSPFSKSPFGLRFQKYSGRPALIMPE